MTETNVQSNAASKRKKASNIINIVLAVTVSFICCLSTPLSTTGYIGTVLSIITVIACAVFAVRFSSRKIATVILLVSLFAIFGLANGMPLIALILSCTVGCGALAWLISKTESPFLAIIPAAAYAIATVMTKNWFASLLTLIFVLPAILLAQSYEKVRPRVSTVARVSVGFLIFIVLTVFLSVLYFTGEFRIEIVTETLDSVKATLVKVMSSFEMVMVNGETQTLMSETDAYNYVSLIISLIPSLTVISCFTAAYFAQKVQLSVFAHTGEEDEFSEQRLAVTMSPASAIVFLLSFTVYFIASSFGSADALSTVTANLYIILLPGLAYVGIKAFLTRKPSAERPGCSSVATSVIIAVLFFLLLTLSTVTALVIAAVYGSCYTLKEPVKKLLSKMNDQ